MIENYTLTLPKSGMDLIITGLSELPYKAAKPVLDEAMRQFIAQEAAAGVPQPPESALENSQDSGKAEPAPPAAE